MNQKKSKPCLSLNKIRTEIAGNSLATFVSGIKSEETKTAYRKTLKEFLNVVEELDGDYQQRADEFAKIAKNNPDKVKGILKDYAQYLKKRTENQTSHPDYLNPNTLPNKFKSIKKFLKMNEIPMEWSGIEAIFPEKNNTQQTRGYTTEEIEKILTYCTDPPSEFIILAESSSGIRVGAWEDMVWSNIKPIYKTKEGTYTHDHTKAQSSDIVCASMIVYGGTSSAYLGLISIEAWNKLLQVRDHWIAKMSREPKPHITRQVLNNSP